MLILASISESLVNETAHFVRDGGLPAIFLQTLRMLCCVYCKSVNSSGSEELNRFEQMSG